MVPGRPGSGIACRNTYKGTVLTLWGDIDALLRENASAAMATLAARPDPDPVIVDARDVTFIDSSGLSMLIGADAESRNDGFGLSLLASRPVQRLIELCDLQDVLPVRG
jgi:anti-anti-sigma factor